MSRLDPRWTVAINGRRFPAAEIRIAFHVTGEDLVAGAARLIVDNDENETGRKLTVPAIVESTRWLYETYGRNFSLNTWQEYVGMSEVTEDQARQEDEARRIVDELFPEFYVIATSHACTTEATQS